MKTKQEIEEKLKIYEEIHKNSAVFSTLANGAITALKWVLEIDEVENSRDKNINRCIEIFKYNK